MTANRPKYTVETSEKIQEDILVCVDGFLVGEDIDDDTLDKLKTALCQIVVDNRNPKPSA